MEIDFQKYDIQSPSLIYMHPDQVHRIIDFKEAAVCAWALDNEQLNADYLQLLEEITPAVPVALNDEQFSVLSETATF